MFPSPTVHFSFVGQDDLSPPARRVYGQGFLEALFDIRTPDAFGVRRSHVLLILESKVQFTFIA